MRLSKARKACVTAMMRDTIFEAASTVLEEHGAHGLTMDRVASTVGVATGSLYNYFRDKDEILQFFYIWLVEPFFQPIEEIAQSELAAPQKLEKIVRAAREHGVRRKGLIRLFRETPQRAEIQKDTRPRFRRILAAVFAQGIREGSLPRGNPAHLARMLQGCLSEMFEMQVAGASHGEVDGYVALLIDAAGNGFATRAERSAKPAQTRTSPPDP